MKFKNDGGYGDTGNITKYYFLYHILDDEQRKEYEKELEEKDPKRYWEFKEWVEMLEMGRKYGAKEKKRRSLEE
ncbi:hypothetical protein [Methanobrevibacter sp.]|uniref:hypothetical protein n=1 Tax=Methanobrevibacter sp. TaxID=66852 RepID=UPI00386B4D2F